MCVPAYAEIEIKRATVWHTLEYPGMLNINSIKQHQEQQQAAASSSSSSSQQKPSALPVHGAQGGDDDDDARP